MTIIEMGTFLGLMLLALLIFGAVLYFGQDFWGLEQVRDGYGA